jgi:hypothetical protein
MLAAERGQGEVVSALLAAYASVNQRDGEGWTALLFAAREDHPEIVRRLIAAGADVFARAEDGTRAVALATDNDNPEVVAILEHALARRWSGHSAGSETCGRTWSSTTRRRTTGWVSIREGEGLAADIGRGFLSVIANGHPDSLTPPVATDGIDARFAFFCRRGKGLARVRERAFR